MRRFFFPNNQDFFSLHVIYHIQCPIQQSKFSDFKHKADLMPIVVKKKKKPNMSFVCKTLCFLLTFKKIQTRNVSLP